MKKYLLAYLFLLIPVFSLEENLENNKKIDLAISKTLQAINEYSESLNKLRSQINKDKIPISKDILSLERQNIKERKQINDLKYKIHNRDNLINDLSNEVIIFEKQLNYISDLIIETRKEMSKNMSVSETILYKDNFNHIDTLIKKNSTYNHVELLKKVYTLSKANIETFLGKNIFKGQVIDLNGELIHGEFLKVGPLTFFVSRESQKGGITGIRSKSLYPYLQYEISYNKIHKMFKGEYTVIPFDVSNGNAFKIDKNEKTFIDHLKSGGIIMIPILFLGIVCIIISIWKFFSLIKIDIRFHDKLPLIIENIQTDKIEEALNIAKELKEPLSPILIEGINHANARREELEEIMHEKIMLEMPFFERGLSILSVGAASAPLLGLLGTVTGMIHTFNMITVFGTGKANMLSGGISEALVTTEFGLIIAIPALIMHAYFARKIKVIIHTLEQMVISFINGMSKK